MSDFDITARLRISSDPDSVDRERFTSENLYRDAVGDADVRNLSDTVIRSMARRSIAAACTFWEEWDIAVLTPDVKQTVDFEVSESFEEPY